MWLWPSISWRLGNNNGSGSFCGAPDGLFLVVFLRTAFCPLQDSFKTFPFLNWLVDTVWMGARGWALLSGTSDWLQREASSQFPHTPGSTKELCPAELSCYPLIYKTSNIKKAGAWGVLQFHIAAGIWESLFSSFYQGLLMTLDFSIVHVVFLQVCRGEKNTFHFDESLSNLLWKRGSDGKAQQDIWSLCCFLKKPCSKLTGRLGNPMLSP